MEFITTLIHQIVEIFSKLQEGGQAFMEFFQAFLKFVGDILRFLEEHGLSKQIVDAIFQLILKIFGAAYCTDKKLPHLLRVRQFFCCL